MRTVFFAIIGCLFMSVGVANAQTPKQIKKVVKTNAKQFAKEGWTLDGTGTFNYVLTNHYTELGTEGTFELVGNAADKKSINLAKTIARNNVINEYVEYARSMVRARINTDLKDMNEVQQENFVAGYERIVVKELEGAIKPSFHMYKKNANGMYDLRGFYLVNEERAASINKKALQQAADEMGVARKYADEVSDFVNDGMNNLKQK